MKYQLTGLQVSLIIHALLFAIVFGSDYFSIAMSAPMPLDLSIFPGSAVSLNNGASAQIAHQQRKTPFIQPVVQQQTPSETAAAENQVMKEEQIFSEPKASEPLTRSDPRADNSASEAAGPVFAAGSRADIRANMGARSIVRPMPQIPDDLREAAFNAVALAQFHIAVDGQAKAELVKPTQNPRLNRLLLDSLKNWRFAPAVRDGRPVESTEEIIIRIVVK
jgi:periplasmic protein TonB